MTRTSDIRWPFWVAGRVVAAIVLAAAGVATPGQAAGDASECRAIQDSAARLRCYETLTAPDAPSLPSDRLSSPSSSQSFGRWRLVRTPNPNGGKEAVSIARPGELSGSDPDFVGLMIRCADTDIEVLIVLISPLTPRARPRVLVDGITFVGNVVAPGSAILLPNQVTALAKQSWRSLSKLTFIIDEGGTDTKGLVLLDDYDAALAALSTACQTRQQ